MSPNKEAPIAAFRGFKVDVSLVGWGCFYNIGLRGEIIVHYYA